MDKNLLNETDEMAETIRSNVSVEVPFEEESSENNNLFKLAFPDEGNSLTALKTRFEQHLGIIRGKHQYLVGKNCLDNYSIDLKIIDSFSDIAFNIHFNQYLLNQLHDAITNHAEFKRIESRGYYFRAVQEADEIARACFVLMKRIKSWVHEGF